MPTAAAQLVVRSGALASECEHLLTETLGHFWPGHSSLTVPPLTGGRQCLHVPRPHRKQGQRVAGPAASDSLAANI